MNLTGSQKYQLLLEISHKIRDTLDLDVIMEHLLDTIKTVLDYDAAGIFVLNQDLVHGRRQQPRELIAGMCYRGYGPLPAGGDDMLNFGKGIIGQVILSGSCLVAPDVRQDPYYIEARQGTLSEIAVPILRNERAIGALNLESDRLSAYDHSDLEVLQFFADAAAIALEKAMLHRQLLEKELLDRQLQMAREMQFSLFPGEAPRIPGYDMAGICIPAEEIGGDYYDFLRLPGGNLGLTVADISGHGISSALVMTSFRGLLRTHTHGRLGPAQIAVKINRLLPEFTGSSQFITMVYAVLNPRDQIVTCVNCGHPPPLWRHADGRWDALTTHGPALGIMEKSKFIPTGFSIQPGEILILYTDGVVEMDNPDGEYFGMERLKYAIDKYRDLSAYDLVRGIIQETRDFSGVQNYVDDFTILVVKRTD